MKNARPPLKAEPSDLDNRKFTGIYTPRQYRVINALLSGPRTREQIDRIAGASNGPEVIRQIRAKGVAIKCQMVRHIDRDGKPGRHGLYHLPRTERAKFIQRLRPENGGAWL